jgi:anthranilate phosphoribosyltransferase
MKTFFNMLGPMVNPAQPLRQLVGVFNLELARLYGYLYQQKPGMLFTIVHDLEGYDEISLTGSVKTITTAGEQLRTPENLGFSKLDASDIAGGSSVAEAAKTLTDILQGKGQAAHVQVVLANAAQAIHTAQPELNMEEAVALVQQSLESGKAWKAFETLMGVG